MGSQDLAQAGFGVQGFPTPGPVGGGGGGGGRRLALNRIRTFRTDDGDDGDDDGGDDDGDDDDDDGDDADDDAADDDDAVGDGDDGDDDDCPIVPLLSIASLLLALPGQRRTNCKDPTPSTPHPKPHKTRSRTNIT